MRTFDASVQGRSADGTTTSLSGRGVILATPAHAAAALTAPILPEVAAQLQSVAYYPVTLVLAEYDRPIFSPHVRAFVFDSRQALSNAGAYGINDLNLVRYKFSGRAARGMGDGTEPGALVARGEAALSRPLAIDRAIARRWRRRFVA